jgi:hypothetical protein
MNVYVSIGSLFILITVLVLQVMNVAKWWDGNGEMKVRVLFIAQILCLILIAICDLFKWPHVSSFAVFILAFNALAFYRDWPIAIPLVKFLKLFKKK